jgi:hypothetical protein
MAGSLYVGRNGVTAWAMLTWGQVATSGEICLDDEDDDPNAIHAMIQHICDSEQTIYLSSPIPDLMFHVNVFAAADKYDVPSLRVLVVSKFVQLMNRRWSNSQQEFCTVVRHLYGPTAPNFADTSLQQSAITFCSEKIKDLPHQARYVRRHARRVWKPCRRASRHRLQRQERCPYISMSEMQSGLGRYYQGEHLN